MQELHLHHWFIIILIVAWAIKLLIGYYFINLVVRFVRPRYYSAKRRLWSLFGVKLPERERRPLTQEELGEVLHAVARAAEMHANQRRKDKAATPYINHPLQVVDILFNVGGVRDVVTLKAGALHDTIEDTGASEESLAREFGKETAAVVLEVSDDKSLPKAERKRLQVENAGKKSQSAREVKLADKISNLSKLADTWTVERKLEYVKWATAVVNQIRGTNAALERMFDETAARALAEIEQERKTAVDEQPHSLVAAAGDTPARAGVTDNHDGSLETAGTPTTGTHEHEKDK